MGTDAVSYHTAVNWFRKFKAGDYNIEDQPHPVTTTKIDVDRLKDRIEQDQTLSTAQLGEEFGCSKKTVANHLHEFGKAWEWRRWVPNELNSGQLDARKNICLHLLSFKRTTYWLRDLIITDGKYILYVNHSWKRQWLSVGQAVVSTPKPDKFGRKVILSVWWKMCGVILWKLLEPKKTVTSEKYCKQLEKVAKKLKGKQERVYYLQENAKPHVSKVTSKKFQELG